MYIKGCGEMWEDVKGCGGILKDVERLIFAYRYTLSSIVASMVAFYRSTPVQTPQRLPTEMAQSRGPYTLSLTSDYFKFSTCIRFVGQPSAMQPYEGLLTPS